MGPLKYSDGSSEWQSQSYSRNIKHICSVNGPIEVQSSNELPLQATVEVVYRPNNEVPAIREELIQEVLNSCLLSVLRRDLIPRSLLQVVIQLAEISHHPQDLKFVLELSEAINCMSTALANNGVPLNGLVAALSYGFDDNGRLWPAFEFPLEAVPQSVHVVAFTLRNSEIDKLVALESSGQFAKEDVFKVLEIAKKDVIKVFQKQSRMILGE